MLLKLNLGRNCLRMIIRLYGIKEIFVPYYSCKTIWSAIKKENCKIKFYHIDENFMPVEDFKQDDYILYINYFGLFEENCKMLISQYKNVIIDNTQAFYSSIAGIAGFNSYRKFFPVTNGASLFISDENKLDKINFKDFEQDKLFLPDERIDTNYEKFKSNELKLNNEPIKLLSNITEEKMKNIDKNEDKQLRQKAFLKYSEKLNKYNLITIPELKNQIPYCYPFCSKDEKILTKIKKTKINILRMWDEIPKSFIEQSFLYNVGALPLYDENLVNNILKSL